MSESGKAVFLSYASQDTEAARRICDALRAAGVEVWFDQSELVGGDAWDAKIRKQIKECALLIPIISAATQARTEGYFRLEWRLADQRTHLMAKGRAFLLPVVIDDTRDTEAHVPDSFTEVQWTKLPGGETSPAFCGRVQQLLDGSGLAAAHPPPAERDRGAASARKDKSAWLSYVFIVFGLVFGGFFGIWPMLRHERAPSAQPGAPAAPLSEARQLTAKVWEQLNKPELARAELETADGFGRRATELDSNDAEAWAAWSQVDSWTVYHNFDTSAARREAARTKAARALQLAPDSYESRLAQACYLVRGQAGGDATLSIYAGEAEKLLRTLLREKPDEPRSLLALGILLRNTGAFPEGRELFRRLAGNPAFAAMAWNELGWAEYIAGDYTAAGSAIDKSIALQAYWGNLTLKQVLAQWWLGDLDRAKAAQDQMPVAARQEDIGVSLAAGLAHWRREPQVMLQILSGVPRDWLQSNGFVGPTAWYAALAHQMAGQEAAAQVQWRAALAVVERRLATQPDSGFLIHWKGTLLAALGNRADAEPVLKLAHEIGSNRSDSVDDAMALIWLNQPDAAIAVLERMAALEKKSVTAAAFRLNPVFDPLRTQPRFQTLLARLEAAPRFSPTANAAKPANGASVADQKSVAVLAFANLSDDKGNEYFSDGISEELLNVLAKVPGLKVSARTSSFHFKGKDTPIPEIAKQLGVAYVVEGSVRKQGDRVRITAQLIKADGGFHVWSDNFTRDLKDIFAVQDEIAGLIAQQLQLKLGESTRAAKVVNPEAYRLLLEGRQFWNLRNEEGFTKAEAAFTKALAIDPQFAEAHAGLGGVCVIRAIYRELDDVPLEANDLTRAVSEGRRALEIDPASADALAVLAYAQMMGNQLAESDRNFQRALTLNPNSALVHCWYALLLSVQGRLDVSLGHYQKAAEVDPLWFINLQMMGQSLASAQRYEQALGIQERANALRTDVFLPNLAEQARTLQALGRKEEACAIARQILRNQDQRPRWGCDARAVEVLLAGGRRQEAADEAARLFTRYPAESYVRGFILAALGRFDDALPFLQRTPATILRQLYWDTLWDSWRDDPRFLQLMAQLGRAEEYQVARATLARMLEEQAKK